MRVGIERLLDKMPRAMIDDVPQIRSPGQISRDWHSSSACWRQGYRAQSKVLGRDGNPRVH